jgi:hypothetical protein
MVHPRKAEIISSFSWLQKARLFDTLSLAEKSQLEANVTETERHNNFCVVSEAGWPENREFSQALHTTTELAPNRARLGVLVCKALRGASGQGALSPRPLSFKRPSRAGSESA